MIKLYLFLIVTSTFVQQALGQRLNINNLVGKTFLSKKLDYLKFLNDTTIYSSINPYNDTASFALKADTFSIKQHYWWSSKGQSGYAIEGYNHHVIFLTPDSFQITHYNKFENTIDTLLFTDIEILKESISAFIYLDVDFSSPWTGEKRITIDNIGRVFCISRPILYSIDNPNADKNAKPLFTFGKLTKPEFKIFKELLSRAMISKLTSERECPMDGSVSTFDILIGNKRYRSTGCDLSWTQGFLLSYILEIDKNKNLVQ